jgi:hypothetical protein
MRLAARAHFAVIFLMVLTLGLPLGFPTEDVPDTTYDESETAPYEGVPLFSIALSPVAAAPTQGVLSFFHSRPGALSVASATVYDTDANQPAARPSMALLCTLRC